MLTGTIADAIGQLFMVGFPGPAPSPEVVDLIARQRVGGVILFTRNIADADQVRRLTADLQATARAAGHARPLLIAADQENGLVRRFREIITPLPGNMALGAIGYPQHAAEVAAATARELRALGVTMNLAPVADVNNHPANPVIGVRSFGDDPQTVAAFVAQAVRGYQEGGVAATLKHFPGHGDTAVDSHRGLPVLPFDLERLRAVEWPPFQAGIAAGAPCVMLAHLSLPGVTPDDPRPATVNPTVIRDLLRDELGFAGVVMTDCLEMAAIAGTLGVAAGAVQALQAGADLILVSHRPDRQQAALAAVHAAVAAGEIAATHIFAAAERVAALRRSWDEAAPQPLAAATRTEHRRLSDQLYARAVTLVGDDAGLAPLAAQPAARVVVVARPPAGVSQAVDRLYQHDRLVAAIRTYRPHTVGAVLPGDDLPAAVANADVIVAALINAHLDAAQQAMLADLRATGTPVVGLALCDPYDADLAPIPMLATYDYSPPALEAAARVLCGQAPPRGRLPVRLSRA